MGDPKNRWHVTQLPSYNILSIKDGDISHQQLREFPKQDSRNEAQQPGLNEQSGDSKDERSTADGERHGNRHDSQAFGAQDVGVPFYSQYPAVV